MYIDIQLGRGHAAWTWACTMDNCCMLRFPVHALLHVIAHASCPCTFCCMPVSVLHVYVSAAWTLNIQHGHGFVAWTRTCSMDVDSSMDMDLQHGPGHAP
jgi:hypothetical protein